MINTNEIAFSVLIVFFRYVLNHCYSNFRILVKHFVVAVVVYIYIEPKQMHLLPPGDSHFLSQQC